MTERKFTPPTKFPTEYVNGNGNKVVILGLGPHEGFPFIGYNADGYAAMWAEGGAVSQKVNAYLTSTTSPSASQRGTMYTLLQQAVVIGTEKSQMS